MKRIFLILLSLLILQPVFAKIITGEVEYNAEAVREEVFATPPEKISFDKIYTKLTDANNGENLNFLRSGVTELNDRKLVQFSDGSYGILYYDDPMYSWYYSQSGRLINFIQKDSQSYPCKFTKYKPDGTVANTGYRVSPTESFIFEKDGRLIAHWRGDYCYDEFNNVIMTRKIVY